VEVRLPRSHVKFGGGFIWGGVFFSFFGGGGGDWANLVGYFGASPLPTPWGIPVRNWIQWTCKVQDALPLLVWSFRFYCKMAQNFIDPCSGTVPQTSHVWGQQICRALHLSLV